MGRTIAQGAGFVHSPAWLVRQGQA